MIYGADFETTVYDGQEFTEVWLAGLVSLDYKEEFIVKTIDDFIIILSLLEDGSIVYFHNLSFDGSFIIDYLLSHGYKQALEECEPENFRMKQTGKLAPYEFKHYISRKGQWYNIIIRFEFTTVIIRDSLKLLPFSLDKLSKQLKLSHTKGIIQYKKFRKAGGDVTENEYDYFKRDLYILAEALNAVKKYGIEGTTIGSCCLKEFRRAYGNRQFKEDFPDLYKINIDKDFGAETIGDYVLKSYCGAFVYVNPEFENVVVGRGFTLDVTSLYPSRMHSSSGVDYPIGKGYMCKGKAIKKNYRYFFQRIRCRFRVRDGYLPFVKIRNSMLYNARECLRASKVVLKNGTVLDAPVELTFTQTELELFLEHYEVCDIEYLDYAVFATSHQIFDFYIDKWITIKNENGDNPVLRFIAKLMLNNLYGKFASSKLSSFKYLYLEDGILRFKEQHEENGNAGYIPVGSAIISEARVFEIRHCQKNYFPGEKRGFAYADTDSIHFVGEFGEQIDIPIAHNKLNTYKLESRWSQAFFNHAKRYIEVIYEDDGERLKEPYYAITCAGLPDRGKELLRMSLTGNIIVDLDRPFTSQELEFVSVKRELTDFSTGIVIPGKNKKVRLPGGIVLVEGEFSIR